VIEKWYRANGGQPDEIRRPPGMAARARVPKPSEYIPDEGLENAVNVALILNQPLLLTGEPGTGKTELARSVAWQLRLGDPLKFKTKSNSTAQELFYTYDALGRFRAVAGEAEPIRFIRFNALGLAILRTREPDDVRDLVPPGELHEKPMRSVILIDEVDKAPRDFPNDLLNELEENSFNVPELHNRELAYDRRFPPIVIITSNSERDLPDAFLRRCVYYNVPFPTPERLRAIVTSRLGEFAGPGSEFLTDALDIFDRLRRAGNAMRKIPATAEFLSWIAAMRESERDADNPLAVNPELALQTLSIIVKTADDQDRAAKILGDWVAAKKATMASPKAG